VDSYLSLTDLFLVGLALDITGAVLLARGLLLSPANIRWVSGTVWGVSEGQLLDRCRNRVYGEFGVVYLFLGFLFQAAGYSFEVAGDNPDSGHGRLLAALALATGAAVVATLLYLAFHGWRERRLLAAVEASQLNPQPPGDKN
jgi:hypothetical protein